MADRRPFAKIDTGYILNPKWFQVEMFLRNHYRSEHRPDDRLDDRADEPVDIRAVVRVAREAHIASILYCAQNVTDGLFPVDIIKSLVVVREHEEPAITALFEVGLWVNEKGGLARVRDYLEHQTSSAQIKKRSEDARKAVEAREAKKTSGRSSTRSSTRSSEEKRREEKLIAEEFASWYTHYPKKVGKGDALKAFKAARKKVELPELIEATRRYAKSVKGNDPKYVKNPGPWLRDERWLDEPTPTATPVYDPWVEERVS